MTTPVLAEAANAHDVFISYSRRDQAFARVLEAALENYTPPHGLGAPRRPLRVFRDEADLSGVEYFHAIERHLNASAKLLVLCSPDSRHSEFVNDEIARFVRTHRADCVVPILLDGVPNNAATAEQETRKAFPEALCDVIQMPLAADFRNFDPRRDKLSKGVFYGAWYTTLANLLNVSREAIEQRDAKRAARRRVIVISTITAVIALLAVALVVTLLAQHEAVHQRNTAEHRRLTSLTQSLARQALLEHAAGAGDRAQLLARQAYVFHVRHHANALGQVDATLRAVTSTQPTTVAPKNGFKVNAIALSPNPALIAAAGSNTIKLLNTADAHAAPRALAGHAIDVVSVAFSGDGRWLASASWDQTVRLWDLSGTAITSKVLRGHHDYVTSVAFSPDSAVLASASQDGTVKLWDMRDLDQEPRVLRGPETAITSVAFSPNGDGLAAGATNGAVWWWNIAAANERPRVLRGAEPVRAIAFSPDGKLLAAGTGRSVTLWVVNGADISTRVLPAYESEVTSIAFSPDGTTLASGELGAKVRLRDLTNADAEVIVLDTHAEDVSAIAYSRDGASLVSASYDGTIQRWVARTSTIAARVCEQTRRNLSIEEWQRLVASDMPYERTCPNRPLHPSYLIYGEDLARQGRVADAVGIFRRAIALDRELIIADPEGDARRFAAAALITQGNALARNGDTRGAAAIFREALQLNPALKLDPDHDANQQAAPALVARGDWQARQGNLTDAVAQFAQAKKIDPSLGFDPQSRADKGVALSRLSNAKQLVARGKVKEAVAAYEDAQQLDPTLAIDVESWNVLCWKGSVWGHAALVMPACDRAIADAEGLDNVGSWDSRGFARALTGDRAGAIADFRRSIELAHNLDGMEETIAQRQAWILALENGKNPLTEEVLRELRQQ